MAINVTPTGVTATVISVLDVPSSDPNRMGKMDALVTYRIDPLHSFTIRLPAEGLTPDKIDAAIRSDYAVRKLLINRVVNL
jgi:hypothetical protein